MKNFIYLSFIAFVLLCSCKSNSFMTQRYTKLGHTPHKYSTKPKVIVNESKRSPVLVKQKNEVASGLDSAVLLATASDLANLPQTSNAFFPKKVIQPLVQTGKRTYAKLSSDLKKNDQQNLNKKKTFKERLHRAAGLFDTLFKIVLWCIILAVLVAIIIIILLT